ncbi:hypothetical protein FHETE_10144 [Fusarium heterosporum]|uniref:Uncharacterized protein n=1 Tax=Fusarium heterosporum TaxID=42747 RepID=A0A8H5SVQ1_FUSHE|nr:hypothetical protein FHETE_10144 [Fusarium heterosporum]
MTGQKSSPGSDKKSSGSKSNQKSVSTSEGSSNKKGKASVQKSTQGELSQQNWSTQNGESSSYTQSTTSEGDTTQTASDQSDNIHSWMGLDPPWVLGDRRGIHNEEEPPKETFYPPNIEMSDDEAEAEAVARKDGKR